MYRGTTPTITIRCDMDVALLEAIWVTFCVVRKGIYNAENQVEITKEMGEDGMDVNGETITVSLTQAETLLLGSLDPERKQTVEVQVRARAVDGRAYASQVMTTSICRILRDGEI